MLHDREHATATKRKCARERERRGATESTQWRQNKREREKRGGHNGNEEAEENYFLLFWMKTERCAFRKVLRCFFFIWSSIYIHPTRMLFIHKRMISSQGGTAYLMNVVGLLLTAGRY
jgi:hypothetical protein